MRDELSKRDKWQDESTERGRLPENLVADVLSKHLQIKQEFEFIPKPSHLRKIYGERGIQPDFAIESKNTGKVIFGEIKRQRAAGNAHERACKYFAPGIVRAAQEIGGIDGFPFWMIFCNGIAISQRYREEISYWFNGISSSLLYMARYEGCYGADKPL